jgi:hypothetical protein
MTCRSDSSKWELAWNAQLKEVGDVSSQEFVANTVRFGCMRARGVAVDFIGRGYVPERVYRTVDI